MNNYETQQPISLSKFISICCQALPFVIEISLITISIILYVLYNQHIALLIVGPLEAILLVMALIFMTCPNPFDDDITIKIDGLKLTITRPHLFSRGCWNFMTVRLYVLYYMFVLIILPFYGIVSLYNLYVAWSNEKKKREYIEKQLEETKQKIHNMINSPDKNNNVNILSNYINSITAEDFKTILSLNSFGNDNIVLIHSDIYPKLRETHKKIYSDYTTSVIGKSL